MRTALRAYVYTLGILQVAVASVIFNEMYHHGWITLESSERLAFALSLVVILTLGLAAADVARLASEFFAMPYPWYAHGVSLLVIAVFAAFGASTHDPYAADGLLIGALVGLLPVSYISLRARPLAGYVERLEERLDASEKRGDPT